MATHRRIRKRHDMQQDSESIKNSNSYTGKNNTSTSNSTTYIWKEHGNIKVCGSMQYMTDEQINRIMESKYLILNKKIDKLLTRVKTTTTKNVNTKDIHTQQRIINLTDIKLTKEQTQVLNLGPNYAVEMEPKKFLNNLIIDTENAIRYLEPKMQNTYRYMATKHIKLISKQNKCNTLHKRQQYIIN